MEKQYRVILLPVQYFKPFSQIVEAEDEEKAIGKVLEKTGDIGREELRISSTNFEIESVEEL